MLPVECLLLNLMFTLSRYYQSGAGASPGDPERRGSSDLVPLHSTTYAVIGIGIVAFLVIVLGLVAVICRLHLIRKSQGGAGGRGTGAGRPHPPITLHDLDIYFSERQGEARGGEYQHIGITYNINHGVQIIPPGPGPAQPPPYSTNPRRQGRGLRQGARGPPPPYMSHENIAAPLLEDDNNNGDINGNSDMQDNNVRPLEAPAPPAPTSNPPAPGPSGASSSSSSGPRASSPPPRYPGLDSSSDTDTD